MYCSARRRKCQSSCGVFLPSFCGTGAKSGFPARRHKKFTFCRLCFCFEFVILIWYVWIGAPIWAFI
nr:MAG TPA: hypothetical protein [Caudoviricetes sp.]